MAVSSATVMGAGLFSLSLALLMLGKGELGGSGGWWSEGGGGGRESGSAGGGGRS